MPGPRDGCPPLSEYVSSLRTIEVLQPTVLTRPDYGPRGAWASPWCPEPWGYVRGSLGYPQAWLRSGCSGFKGTQALAGGKRGGDPESRALISGARTARLWGYLTERVERRRSTRPDPGRKRRARSPLSFQPGDGVALLPFRPFNRPAY